MSNQFLSTKAIMNVFTEQVISRGGQIVDIFDDGLRLFTRSILPHVRECRPTDRLQGGVALKASRGEIVVQPYVFRQVCRNGMIMAHCLFSEHLADLQHQNPEYALYAVGEALAMCCREDVFEASMHSIRSAVDARADRDLEALPSIARLPTGLSASIVDRIFKRFGRGKDKSRFGLANAITSVARDTFDPDLRWRLEELGGAVAVGVGPKVPVDQTGAQNIRPQPQRRTRKPQSAKLRESVFAEPVN